MSEEDHQGLAMGNELGFLWELDDQSQLISAWKANLSNNDSENYSGGNKADPSPGHEEKKTETPPAPAEKTNTAPKKKKGGTQKRDGGGNNNEADGAKLGEAEHEIHIWTERERRKKMKDMFSNLHALLPHLPSKADKSTVVDEAVNYIQTLQHTLQMLQKKKLEKLQSRGAAASTSTAAAAFTLSEPSSKLANRPHDQTAATREAFLADQGSCSMNNPSNTMTPDPSTVVFDTWSSSNVVLNVSGDEAHISICSPNKPGFLTSICYILEKFKIAVVSAHISSDGGRNMYMIHAHASGNGGWSSDEPAVTVKEVFKKAAGEIMYLACST